MNNRTYTLLLVALFVHSAPASIELPVKPYLAGLTENLAEFTTLETASIPELRKIFERSSYQEQLQAAKILLSERDEETVARLAFAFKQGNQLAEMIMRDSASLQMIPYLMEDVAHGRMDKSGTGVNSIGRVRVAATAIVTAALAGESRLPPETVEWFKTVDKLYSGSLIYVPEQSKALVDWWTNNESAVISGRLEDAIWLPAETKIIPKIFEDWRTQSGAKLPPPPPLPPQEPTPMSALPLHVAESFEEWSARVIDPNRRNITWATVNFETGESVRVVNISKPEISQDERRNSRTISNVENQNNVREVNKNTSTFMWMIVIVTAGFGLWMAIKARV